jgi:hypothetical protein
MLSADRPVEVHAGRDRSGYRVSRECDETNGTSRAYTDASYS